MRLFGFLFIFISLQMYGDSMECFKERALGNRSLKQGHYPSAVKHFTKCLALSSNEDYFLNYDILLDRGYAYLMSDEDQSAFDDFHTVVSTLLTNNSGYQIFITFRY